MLSRYDGKPVRITTDDGEVFVGTAESFPSGYGLLEFDREEESVCVQDTQIFLSQIAKIEPLSEPTARPCPEQCFALIGRLIDGPYWIADILPEQVPADAPGQYFQVDRYYRKPARMEPLRRKQAEILLRLNCYDDMTVSFDNCETWETNPEPEAFVNRLEKLQGNVFLRALFLSRETMIDIELDDTWMTVYSPEASMRERVQSLCEAEGLFFWQPAQGTGD